MKNNNNMQIKARDITNKTKGTRIVQGFLKCGDCTGLDREALITGEKAKCSDQGMIETAKACPKFKPDLFRLRDLADEGDFDATMQFVSQIINKIPNDQYGLVASIFLQAKSTAESGFQFYQPVYVRYRGTASSNYMSNFMTAYVLDATATDVRLVSADPRQKQFTLTFVNHGLEGPTIYSAKAFKPLREMMIEKGKLVDPKESRNTPAVFKPTENFDLSVMSDTSLDGFNGSMHEVMRANGIKPTNKSTKKLDGVDLTGMIAGGFSRKLKKKKKKSSAMVKKGKVVDLAGM